MYTHEPMDKRAHGKACKRVKQSKDQNGIELGCRVGIERACHLQWTTFYINIDLYSKLEAMGIYATGAIKANRIGLPKAIANIK